MTSNAALLAFVGGPEFLIVGAIVLLLFGGTQIPKLARSLGQAQREFKTGQGDDSESDAPVAGSLNPPKQQKDDSSE